jgi:DNA-binding transcriptional ArsR family regulator
MKKLPIWIKLPSAWINDGGLHQFRWGQQGANNTAALMALAVIAHHVDPDTGIAHLTYDALSDMTSLSRAKVSGGLSLLAARRLINKEPEGRSSYGLQGYDPASGWAKFPARGLYHNDVVSAFTEFRLRRPAELEALKLYFLFAARRSRDTNMAHITYEQIASYSGVHHNYIRRALTVLGANGLIHVERLPCEMSDVGVANAYRLTYLESRAHMGTVGRRVLSDVTAGIDTPRRARRRAPPDHFEIPF